MRAARRHRRLQGRGLGRRLGQAILVWFLKNQPVFALISGRKHQLPEEVARPLVGGSLVWLGFSPRLRKALCSSIPTCSFFRSLPLRRPAVFALVVARTLPR